MENINWNEVKEASGFDRLPAGGYVCVITAAEDMPKDQKTHIEFDILEGEQQSFFTNLAAALNFWPGKHRQSYKPKARGFYKAMLNRIKESNPDFIFNNDPQNLVSKMVGMTIAQQEYRADDGSTKKRYYVDRFYNVEDIRKGNFKMPEDKLLEKPNDPMMGFAELPDDEPPF